MNLALDEVLTDGSARGAARPTLRIWEWDESAVVIGSFQSYRNEVDPEAAAKSRLRRRPPHLRRRRDAHGRRADHHVLALRAGVDLVQGMTFADSYAFLDDWVLQALRSLGIDAVYQPLNDIASPSGKIGGAAQKRLAQRRGAAPRDAVVRHRRTGHDRGAAHRPREAQRQGHDVRRQARRPAAQPDRPDPRRDHRALQATPSARSRPPRTVRSPPTSTPTPRPSSSRSSRPTRGCTGFRDRPLGGTRGGSRSRNSDGCSESADAFRGIDPKNGPVSERRCGDRGRGHHHRGRQPRVGGRPLPSGSFTLVYLDPPFNTGRTRNARW